MELLASLVPEGVAPVLAAAVIFASFFTSALTASFGLGGGLALLAVMSATLPAAAVIPVHGVAQLGANFSRFTLQQRHVLWPIILWFALGSALGAFVGGLIANMLGYGQVEPGFNLKSFLFAVGGSVILLVVYRFVRGKS